MHQTTHTHTQTQLTAITLCACALRVNNYHVYYSHNYLVRTALFLAWCSKHSVCVVGVCELSVPGGCEWVDVM